MHDATEVRALFDRCRATGDPVVRERLVLRHLPLARSLAARYARGPEPFDDLLQVACLGLIKAVDRYDPERPCAFTTFAVPTILGELKRYFRDGTWAVRVPHSVHDGAMRVRAVQRTLPARRAAEPPARRLARSIGMPEPRVRDALDALVANDVVPLEPSGEEGAEPSLAETLGQLDDGYRLAEERADVDRLLSCVSAQEQRVLRLRFGEELTQRQIAEQLGVSQMTISRLLARCLPRLRELAEAQSLEAA
jgi:RNA polymerase sigma-B factor